MVFRKPLGAALMAVTLFSLPVVAVEDSLQQQETIDKSAVTSQKRIDSLADQTSDDLQNYRIASQRLESLTIYNQQMEKLIASQKAEIASIQKQTAEIDNIETGALPLMFASGAGAAVTCFATSSTGPRAASPSRRQS